MKTPLNRPIYKLSWGGNWDAAYRWENYYFVGPEGSTTEGFKAICDGLMREGATTLTATQGGPYVGYPELVAWVAQNLPSLGYEPLVEAGEACYEDGLQIRTPADDKQNVLGGNLQAVIDYNRASDTFCPIFKR